MKKRIYRNFLCLILSAVLLLSVLLSLFFYNSFKSSEISSVKDSAGLIADFLNRGVDGELSDYIGSGGLRITLVAPDGTVLLDNQTAADSLENHGNRTEILDALQNGRGEVTRYSNTLLAETYYYALRLDNGNILRLSKTIDSMAGVFTASLPVVFIVTALILLTANFLAHRLTDNIIRPLDSVDFDDFAEDNTTVYDELSPFLKRIKEQKREIAGQIAALKNRFDTIEAISENMREGLILLDQNGMVLTANKAVSEIFGDGGTVKGNILHVCRDIDFQQGVKRCFAGESAEISFERGGKTYSVYFSPVPGDSGIAGGYGIAGDSGGVVIFFFDVTERHRAERQRREFSANVSHELKTPLTSISALSEMIENGMAKDNDIKGFAAKISEQAGRLVNIIDDIIKLAEFDEGKAGGEDKKRETFDLYELAESVVNALCGNSKGVAINLAGERFDISANRYMVDELLYNLIDNGIKYNKDGGSVTVALSRENGLCKIAVADTGIGISKEHQSRIFERFYRADKSRSKKTGGTGLGLSIVKHIAEYHGGGVELESTEGAGTTVVCWLTVP